LSVICEKPTTEWWRHYQNHEDLADVSSCRSYTTHSVPLGRA